MARVITFGHVVVDNPTFDLATLRERLADLIEEEVSIWLTDIGPAKLVLTEEDETTWYPDNKDE